MRIGTLVFLTVLTAVTAASAQLQYRPKREYRSLNTASYQVSVQKSGRLNVTLTDGNLVFTSAFPMIAFEGDQAPKPLPIDGRYSTRIEVNDRLGRGNGMLLKKGGCDWIINTYETQPFFTAQVIFTNTKKVPVKVKMLLPWCVGDPTKGRVTLGAGTEQTVFLENEQGLYSVKRIPTLVTGEALSFWNLAGYNPVSRRSLVTGFLTTVSAFPQVHVQRGKSAEPDSLGLLRAECVYDPPIEVPPGARLESEVFYVAVSEANPLEGLERYGHAVARFNNVQPNRAFLPHGWDSWNTKHHAGINEDAMLAALDFVDKNLKRYGWTHFAMDDGWALENGDWDPDPERFPHGMKWFADQVHARGMTAGLWCAPFRVSLKSAFAKAHPDWLAEPSGFGRQIMSDNDRILDITAPGAYDYVKSLASKITKEWGFDAIMEADFVYYLLFMDKYHDMRMTRAEVMRMGMRALREGMGGDKFLMSFPPGPTNGPYVDGMRIGNDCAPQWRKAPDGRSWGCVETLTNAARRYYFAPYLWAPDQDCAYFGHEATRQRWKVTAQPALTPSQSIAWLTGAALTGGVLKIGDCFNDLTPHEVGILRKLLPVPERPARPVDLFENDPPRIWSLPIASPIGSWQIVAVFNWGTDTNQDTMLTFPGLGLSGMEYYTVYDFWADTYYGTAHGQLKVTVAPGSVRLLGLKPLEGHPMFLSTDRHFTQGATDFKTVGWNEADKRLTGIFDGVANTDYNLRVLVPDEYQVRRVAVSAGLSATAQEGKILKIAFHCSADGPVQWSVDF